MPGTDETDSNMGLRVINKLIKKGNQGATLMEVKPLAFALENIVF